LCRPIYAKEVEIKFEKGNNLRDSFVLPMSILSSLAGAPLCAIGGALTTTHVIDHFPLWMVAPSSIGFIGFTYFFLMQKRVNNQIRNHPQTAKLSHLAYLCEKEELENYRRKAGFNHPLISGKGGHHD